MNDSSPSTAGIWRFLLGAAIVALVVRGYALSSQSFTNDELIDLRIAKESWSSIVYKADGFPPLHHLILKFCGGVVGGDLVGRWLSVIYGVLAVPIVGLLAQRVAGNRCGVVAAGLLAVSPMHIFYSQEGRSYALYFLLTALATWLFWRALQQGTTRAWIVFALAASCGGYAHYYFCFVLFAYALIWFKQSLQTGIWRPGLLAFVGISIMQIPLFALVGYDIACQQTMRQGDFNFAAVGYTGWVMLAGMGLGHSPRELHGMDLELAIQGVLPWLLPISILVVGLVASLCRRSHPYRSELLLLLIVPIAGACGVSAWSEISHYNVRYAIPSLVPLVVMMAIVLTRTRPLVLAALLTSVLLTVNTVSYVNRFARARYQNENSQDACQFIVDHTSHPERVFAIAQYMQESVRYYLPPEYPVFPIDDVNPDPQTLETAAQLINQQQEPFWIFYSREFHGDPHGVFKQALLNDARVKHQGTWAGVELYRGVAPFTVQREKPAQ